MLSQQVILDHHYVTLNQQAKVFFPLLFAMAEKIQETIAVKCWRHEIDKRQMIEVGMATQTEPVVLVEVIVLVRIRWPRNI